MYMIQHCFIYRPSDSTVTEETYLMLVQCACRYLGNVYSYTIYSLLWQKLHVIMIIIKYLLVLTHDSWVHDLDVCSPQWLRLSWGRWWWQWSSQANPPEWSAQSPTSPTGETPSGVLKKLEFYFSSESNEWFFEVQAFSPSFDLAPPIRSVSSTGDTGKRERKTTCWRGEGGRGWGRSQIIWGRERLVLYNSYSLTMSIIVNVQ